MFHHNVEIKQYSDGGNYESFLLQKQNEIPDSGFTPDHLNEYLFSFQHDIVKWALRKGKAALFEDTGLGKTIQQLAWADAVAKHTHGKVLILAPLAVSKQTAKEAQKFGILCNLCESDADVVNGINITNYEKIQHFNTDQFSGIVLDESSILKSYAGKTTSDMIHRFRHTPYKLACTATPSPNDFTELGNHAEFLDVCTMNEMLSMFFINDYSGGIGWRLKRHSTEEFFKWIGEWAIMIKSPADLGFDGSAFKLPQLNIESIVLESKTPENQLFDDIGGKNNTFDNNVVRDSDGGSSGGRGSGSGGSNSGNGSSSSGSNGHGSGEGNGNGNSGYSTVDGTGIKSNSTVMDGNTVGTSSSAPVTESATAYNLNVDEDPAAARSLSLGGMNAPVLIILILLILACAAELIKRSKRDIK